MGFFPSKADPDVWMRKAPDKSCYEYVAVYVDNLMVAMKNPKAFFDELKGTYGFKLKGDGSIDYHLGLNFYLDKDGTMIQRPAKYIEKMVETYVRMYKEKPPKAKTPLEKGDHPEVDTSSLCDEKGKKEYMSICGQLQWLVSLGRFDIFSAVVTMSRFRVTPRIGQGGPTHWSS